MKQAVIDIGTNTTRMMIARRENGVLIPEDHGLQTTRLGEGISRSTRLREEAMRRTAQAVGEFAERARTAGAERIFVYATAAVREAENAAEFAGLVRECSGLTLRVLSGEEEARIAFTGACEGREDCAVIDIGGGSTEVMLKNGGQLCALSRKIGCVRLKERFALGDGHLCRGTVMQVEAWIRPHLESYAQIGADAARELIAVSGTATTLAAMELGISKYDGARVQGLRLSRERVRALTQRLCEASAAERAGIPGVPADRADILPYGALILLGFMERFGYDAVTVSDRDSLEGFLTVYGGE